MVAKKKSNSVTTKEIVAREETLESVNKVELIYFKYISVFVLVLIACFWMINDGYWYVGVPVLVFFLFIPWIAEQSEERNIFKKK
jgi:hypothetical protein